MSRTRRRFTSEQKAQVVRRHLADKVAVSTLAEELSVQPSQIHGWVNQMLAQADRAFERVVGITHARTSPHYPQSNGKIERWHGSLKRECVRPAPPRRLMKPDGGWPRPSNTTHARLRSAIGYVTPADKLNGLAQVILDERKRKLKEARHRRQKARQAASPPRSPPEEDDGRLTTIAGGKPLPQDRRTTTTPHDPDGGYGSAEVRPERRAGG